ncbi:desulfoferrodoxin family protein [Thermodesulfobacteriota bacterium]
MMQKAGKILVLCGVLLLCLAALPAYADKSSVEIEAPTLAEAGTVVTIKVNVKHQGNNFMHYTKWVYMKVNGEEVARWDFSWTSRPEEEAFSRQVEYTLDGPIEIEAEASCNIHGSAGKAHQKVEAR